MANYEKLIVIQLAREVDCRTVSLDNTLYRTVKQLLYGQPAFIQLLYGDIEETHIIEQPASIWETVQSARTDRPPYDVVQLKTIKYHTTFL